MSESEREREGERGTFFFFFLKPGRVAIRLCQKSVSSFADVFSSLAVRNRELVGEHTHTLRRLPSRTILKGAEDEEKKGGTRNETRREEEVVQL